MAPVEFTGTWLEVFGTGCLSGMQRGSVCKDRSSKDTGLGFSSVENILELLFSNHNSEIWAVSKLTPSGFRPWLSMRMCSIVDIILSIWVLQDADEWSISFLFTEILSGFEKIVYGAACNIWKLGTAFLMSES